jgi:hypothetical protein
VGDGAHCLGRFHRLRAGRTKAFYALLGVVLVAALAVGNSIVFNHGSKASPAVLTIFVSDHASQKGVFTLHTTLLSTHGLSNCLWWSNARPMEVASFQGTSSKRTRPYFQCRVLSSSELTAAFQVFRGRPGELSVVGSPYAVRWPDSVP